MTPTKSNAARSSGCPNEQGKSIKYIIENMQNLQPPKPQTPSDKQGFKPRTLLLFISIFQCCL